MAINAQSLRRNELMKTDLHDVRNRSTGTVEVLAVFTLCAIGAYFAFLMLGALRIDPTSTLWLDQGDIAQHFLGWHFTAIQPLPATVCCASITLAGICWTPYATSVSNRSPCSVPGANRPQYLVLSAPLWRRKSEPVQSRQQQQLFAVTYTEHGLPPKFSITRHSLQIQSSPGARAVT